MGIFSRLRARADKRGAKQRAKPTHSSRDWREQDRIAREARRDAEVFRNDPNMIIGGLGWTDQSRRNQR